MKGCYIHPFSTRQVVQVLLTTAAENCVLWPAIKHAPRAFRGAAARQAGDVGTADERGCGGNLDTAQGVEWICFQAQGVRFVNRVTHATAPAARVAREQPPVHLAVAGADLSVLVAANQRAHAACTVL